ncbi:hypothetical protein BKA62DRAFT_724363 [Auriculariales sp. MPI-PUGE-AT-0066]|nr:hypothetical protein BKA62DRAFT_724363 [Auriculariales sp. MPI-PUGE-AT-0066]
MPAPARMATAVTTSRITKIGLQMSMATARATMTAKAKARATATRTKIAMKTLWMPMADQNVASTSTSVQRLSAIEKRDANDKLLVRCVCCGGICQNRAWSDSASHRFSCPLAVTLFELGEFTRWIKTHIPNEPDVMRQLGGKHFESRLHREATMHAHRRTSGGAKLRRPQLNSKANRDENTAVVVKKRKVPKAVTTARPILAQMK